MAREQCRARTRHSHGDPTSLAPHERLTDLAVVPTLEKLKKEGEPGIRKINEWTRYLTVIVCLSAGSIFLMWLGEQIDAYGIGNGVSLIITANIIARMPLAIDQVRRYT